VVFNIEYNPVYKMILDKLKFVRKPFNCLLCMSFWVSTIYVCIMGIHLIPIVFITPLLSIVIDRLIDLIPITIKHF